MQPQNVIILHGCPSVQEKAMDPVRRTYDKHWIPWTKQQLTSRGIEVETPVMPEPWKPDYERYKAVFDALTINEQTILIGHSCGAAFLVRWLGDTKRTIAKLILVAPWKIPDPARPEKKPFYTYEIDPTVASRVTDLVIFTSNDEEEDGKKSVALFHESLGGTVIELTNHGHYTLGDMGTDAFPELIETILE